MCSTGYPSALGMESGDIRNDQITASSHYHGATGGRYAWEGRLNNDDCWVTATSNPTDPWIQVELLRTTVVTGIITQGRPNCCHWVTNLQIQYGDSESTLMYIIENGEPKVSTLTMLTVHH